MKLIYDNDSHAELYSEDTINEETGRSEKRYKIKGIFSTIGQKNRNGRIYPMSLWETQINKYQSNIKTGSINCLMEYQHPARTNVDPMRAVAKIDKLYIKDNYVMGEAILLNNPEANQLKSLIDCGIKISVSSRGVGSVKNGIVESFNLITYDIVPDPSDYNATMNGLVENYQLNEGVINDLNFDLDPDGNIVPMKEQNLNIGSDDFNGLKESNKTNLSNAEIMTSIESLFKKHIDTLVESKHNPFEIKDGVIEFNNIRLTENHLTSLYNNINEEGLFDVNDCLCFTLKSFMNALSTNDKIQINEMVEKLEKIIKPNTKYLIN